MGQRPAGCKRERSRRWEPQPGCKAPIGRPVSGCLFRQACGLRFLFQVLVDFSRLIAVFLVVCVGAGVVVVTGKVGDKEIGVLRLIVGLRGKRRTDGRDAGVGDGAGGEPGAGVGVVGFQNVLRDAVPAAVVGRDPVPEVVVVGVALDIAGGVALQFGVG